MYQVQTHGGRFVPNSYASKPSGWRTKRSCKRLSTAAKHYSRLTSKRVVGGVRVIDASGAVVPPYLYASPDCAAEVLGEEVAA
jgi:hypothetical protein